LMTNLKIFAAVLVFLFVQIGTSFAQTPDFQTVKTEKGMMVLNNNKAQPFSFLVAGNNPQGEQNNDGSLSIRTDSNGVTVHFIKTADFLETKKTYSVDETLKAHKAWDIATQENAGKEKLPILAEGFDFISIFDLTNNLFPNKTINSYYWSYTVAESQNRVFYQTVLLGDLVLMLGTGFDESVKTEDIRLVFREIFKTITLLPQQKAVAKPKKIKVKRKK
jgi:hypothetical protein